MVARGAVLACKWEKKVVMFLIINTTMTDQSVNEVKLAIFTHPLHQSIILRIENNDQARKTRQEKRTRKGKKDKKGDEVARNTHAQSMSCPRPPK